MYRKEQKQVINDILRSHNLPSAEEYIEKAFHQEWAADELQDYPDEQDQPPVPDSPSEPQSDAEPEWTDEAPKDTAPELLAQLPALWKCPNASRPRNAIVNDFLKDYKAYVSLPVTADDDDAAGQKLLAKLLTHLSDLCTYIIHRKLRTLFFFQPGDEMDLTLTGHNKAMRSLRADRAGGILRDNAAAYYCRIYKNVTLDHLRYHGICKKKDENQKKNTASTSALYESRHPVSLEKLTTSINGEDMFDHCSYVTADADAEDRKFHSDMCRSILKCYFQTLLNYDHTPPAPLALMYARVLYNVERLLNPKLRDKGLSARLKKTGSAEDQVQMASRHFSSIDGKSSATSAQWAVARMGKATIAKLISHSEETLQQYFDTSLKWGSGIRSRLTQPVSKGAAKLWKDVVYTDAFSQRTIAQYALDCHKSMMPKTVKAIRENQELMDYLHNSCCGNSLNQYLSAKHGKSKKQPAPKEVK